ncbi:MAG: tRNA preQ1(34) S-adenosylmethionine ribosyltransferase-isomerase QueA [Oligoflexia bacterium]|nr:tRNA preQ1(34) S-adenosylmethionine ribosyltransferase-isomerase QueA [Oligoflexia bacterium]
MTDQNIDKNIDQDIDFKLSAYDYTLPPHLIATRPIQYTVANSTNERHHSRLLVYDQSHEERHGKIYHQKFYHLIEHLPPRALLVMNQSKVIPSRLLGNTPSGKKVEIFINSIIPHRMTHSVPNSSFKVLIKSNGKKRIGDIFLLGKGQITSQLVDILPDGIFAVTFQNYQQETTISTADELLTLLKTHAQLPLPPYIRNGIADLADQQDYQTIYAHEQQEGSVAAPTAGLHFSNQIICDLLERGIEIAKVTLHVGAGTFAPVRNEDIREHHMHTEFYSIDKQNLEKINNAKREQRAIIAVGTTSLRALESALLLEKESGMPIIADRPYATNLFIYPHSNNRITTIHGLITNFHWPKSTLLMLVCALIGREKTLSLYQNAIENGYRFFSYGDAMFIKTSN